LPLILCTSGRPPHRATGCPAPYYLDTLRLTPNNAEVPQRMSDGPEWKGMGAPRLLALRAKN
jgi:hypothetical protein